MVWQWLGSNWTQAWLVAVSTVGVAVAVITYTRIAGLRSFSKMSSFDFAITVAFGSVIASVAVFPGARLLNGVIALGALYLFQGLVAAARRHRSIVKIVDNVPLLLMAGDELLHDNLSRARLTENDLRGKLRQANVLNYGQIRAVVFEQTGNISVLHGDDDFDPDLLSDVIGVERLRD